MKFAMEKGPNMEYTASHVALLVVCFTPVFPLLFMLILDATPIRLLTQPFRTGSLVLDEALSVAGKEQLSYQGFLAELLLAECDDRDRCSSIRRK